jgi:hypothetical protein
VSTNSPHTPTEAILVTAEIKPGHVEAVRAIVAEGPPFELPIDGISHNCVFVHRGAIAFLFEGPPGLRRVVRSLMTNRQVAGQLMRMGVHLTGMPREFETAFRWNAAAVPDEGPAQDVAVRIVG